MQPIERGELEKFWQTLEICENTKESRSQLDDYLLNVAKTYVAELLKNNYLGLFKYEDILKD